MRLAPWLTAALVAAAFSGQAGAWTTGPFIVYFDFNSRSLAPPAVAILDNLAATLNARPEAVVLIGGHADRTGPPGHNRMLSCQRARAAQAYLVAKGVAAERMAVAAHGEDRPFTDTDDGVREPQNRRVEFIFPGPVEFARARAAARC
jgi:OmpA-OmpF porin, OOP family